MSKLLRERFFWVSYGKFAAGICLGLGAVTIAGGVEPLLAVRLAAGAIIGFPIAFDFGARRNSP